MIETSRAIELHDDRWQLRAHTPLVGASASRFDFALPSLPPSRRISGERLDDEKRIALLHARHQLTEHSVPDAVRHFIQRERREQGGAFVRQSGGGKVALS